MRPQHHAGDRWGQEDAGSFRDGVNNRQRYIAPVIDWRPDADANVLLRAEYLDRDAALDRGLGNSARFLDLPLGRNFGEEFMRIEKQQWSVGAELNRQLTSDWRMRAGGFVSDVDVPPAWTSRQAGVLAGQSRR